MDDEIGDILFGGDPDELILGKAPDFIRPFRIFAIVLGVAIVGNFFFSLFVEEYRMRALIMDVSNISMNAIQNSVEEMQNIGESNMEYLYEDGGTPTENYKKYLDTLESVPDDELKKVVNLLKYGDSNGEMYTPLSFNLTYLDSNRLKDLLDINLTSAFSASNSTEFASGVFTNGSFVEQLIMGPERMAYESCEVEVKKMSIINITDISSCTDTEKEIYKAVYGTLDQNASKLDGVGLTDNHYLIVYQVGYKINWTPFARSFFFQRIGKSESVRKNSEGFVAMPEQTFEFEKLYYTTN